MAVHKTPKKRTHEKTPTPTKTFPGFITKINCLGKFIPNLAALNVIFRTLSYNLSNGTTYVSE